MDEKETEAGYSDEVEVGYKTAEGEVPYKYIEVEITENLARLTLNRPPYNVLTIDMMKEIARAIDKLHAQHQVRALLIQASAECKAFSAGVAMEDSRPERA